MYLRFIVNTILSAFAALALAIYFHKNYEKRVSLRVPTNPVEPLPASHSPLYTYKNAAVCTDSNVCSSIASNTLHSGGSAVDAALAALLCNGLLGMQSMGLGGGMLMNIYVHSERRSYSIISREMAPLSLLAENFSTFRNERELKQSSWSIAVPTELMGYDLAHKRFGKLPWQHLVEPTLRMCRKGYVLSKHQHDALLLNLDMIKNDELLQRMFVNPTTGEFRHVGSMIKAPDQLCDTYEYLAKHGARSFYKGTYAKILYADLLEMGSLINEHDLAKAHAKLSASIVLPLDEYDLHLTPLPGSGYVLGFIMNILKVYRRDFERARNLGALELHRIIEAMKFGFVQRWELDEASDEQLLEKLTNPMYAAAVAQLINDTQTYNSTQFYGATTELRSRAEQGTSHISVLAKEDAVSVTSSINFYFGSGRMGKRSGVLFNNAMTDFSIKHLKNYFNLPHIPNKNEIAAAARPMSSMTPIIVTQRSTGKVRLVVGAAGGTKIISALVPLLVRTLWQQASIKSAIDASRVHHQMLPNILQYEYGLLQSDLDILQAKGHRCERYLNRGSVICGIERLNDTMHVNVDYRKLGGVAGF